MDHHRGSRIFLAGSWTSSQINQSGNRVEGLCCLVSVYVRILVRIRTNTHVLVLPVSSASASRPTVAKMVGSEKLPNLSRQDFLAAICRRFLNIAIFAEFKKNGASMCLLWILKTKRRGTSDVADFHRESAKKGRNRQSFIYCGGRQVAEAGLVRSILLITDIDVVEHFPNPTIKFKSGHKISSILQPGTAHFYSSVFHTWIPDRSFAIEAGRTEGYIFPPLIPSDLSSRRRHIVSFRHTYIFRRRTLSQSYPGTSRYIYRPTLHK